jgi:FkbM family methyltransferase
MKSEVQPPTPYRNVALHRCSGLGFGSWLALPMIRHELPGWGRIAAALSISGSAGNQRWQGAPWKTVRGKWHGYEIDLNLADWSERQTWFLARYHELNLQLLMNTCLRHGERVIDVGANIGMLSLHAASRVSPTGVVDSFEPNPLCCQRIREVLNRNKIHNVRLHGMGLSDSSGTLTLNILDNHAGMGTFAPVDPGSGLRVTSSINVPVQTGDQALPNDDRPVVFVKIDVEGFEVRALRGLRETLQRYRPIVVTEVIAEWLERAGSSVAELVDLMRGLDYEGFGLGTRRRYLRHQLRLTPFRSPADPPSNVFDVAWVPKTGALRSRLIN